MRTRKYRRLLALLLLNLVLLGGMMTYAALRSDGYEVRVLPVSEWRNRERAWGITVQRTNLLQRLKKSQMWICSNTWAFARERSAVPKYCTIYQVGVLQIGTWQAFEVELAAQIFAPEIDTP
jgi:hypothetical protein